MTETIDQLIQARFDTVANDLVDSDWPDVLARAGSAKRTVRRRRAARRASLVAAAGVAAAAVTAVAFGLPQDVIDFFTSPPAPAHIKNWFGALSVGAPRGMDPRAIPGQARKIATARFDANHAHAIRPTVHTLYVAPKRGGGFCYLWTDASGGCLPATPPPDTAGRSTGPLGLDWYSNDYAVLVTGWVRTGATKTVEARFADGTTATIPVTWVSAPVDAGFLVYPVPEAHRTRADALTSVVALDADGNVLGRQRFRLTKPIDQHVVRTMPDGTKLSISRRAEISTAEKAVAFRSTNGTEVYLWLMKRTGGGVCYAFNRGEGCNPAGFFANVPGALNGGLSGGSDPVLFFAETRPDVASVELRYQNDEVERLIPVDGFVLTEITPAHYERGTRLVAAVALDRSGETIFRERFRPQDSGLYPCKTPIDEGYGVKACP